MSTLDIIYHQDFDTKKGNLMEVTQDFLKYLDDNQSITIKGSNHVKTGDIDEDLILSTDEKTYKLTGINLPTSLLILNQKGTIDLELSHFVKLEDYDHQYHKIYQRIKEEAAEQVQFQSLTLDELSDKYGIGDQQIKESFKISFKEFKRFQEFVNFYWINDKRLFVPVNILLKYMRNLLPFLSAKNLVERFFAFEQIQQNQQLNDIKFLQLVAKMFKFDVQQNRYKVTFESIIHFIVIELASAKNQYVGYQMDELIKGMINVYVPLGVQTPSEQDKKSILKRVIARYFIQSNRNNTILRIYYDPLQIESSLKGRIKFMAGFKNRFSKQQIRGVFQGLIIRETSRQIKQLNQGNRKSIDMDDLLLKNFRKFNQLYQIKLILPK